MTTSPPLIRKRTSFKETFLSLRTVENKVVSYLVVVLGVVGGVGGALLFGWVFEEVVIAFLYSATYVTVPDMGHLILPALVLLVAGLVGNVVLWLSFTLTDAKLRWTALAFSVPIPIVIEVIDIPLRFMSALQGFSPS